MEYFLGLDTSCYTTSAALIDSDNNLLSRSEIPLQVDRNKGGLRQSEGIFQHTKNISLVFKELTKNFNSNLSKSLHAIAVSSKPRPTNDSYMPVFLVGKNQAEVLGSTLDLPVYNLSHQEGHIGAGLYDNLNEIEINSLDKFLVVHVSGGTTEILLCKPRYGFTYMDIEIIGGTKDISAGQLIDRTAKLLSLPFPGGPAIEKLANQLSEDPLLDIPISVTSTDVNFSGAETFVKRTVNEKFFSVEAISFSLQKNIAISLERMLSNAMTKFDIKKVLFVGGVMSNNYIKDYLKNRLSKNELIFCSPDMSKDNAVGMAWLSKNNYYNSY